MGKINIAELLKDCPKGMELDCAMYDDVTFNRLQGNEYIIINRGYNGGELHLTKFGQMFNSDDAKCVIFPKGKTTWEGFQRPFKDGDIIATDLGSVFILKSCLEDKIHYHSYIGVTCCNEIQEKQIPFAYKHVCHLATEEEKAKLFQAIKENGYKWNPETKTFEKLIEHRFKVGDKIRHKCPEFRGERIVNICCDTGYWTTINDWIDIKYQDNWELVHDKFDINTLVPFESRVLARDNEREKWVPAFWGFYDVNSNYPYKLIGFIARYCIPYEGNEHLLGTTDDCDEHFKTWK